MADSSSLIDKEYFKDHYYLFIYLEDAIAQMLSIRQKRGQHQSMKPMKFFKEYFTSVYQGSHILFREFSFLSATPYNRLCVLKALLQIFKPFLYHQDYRFDAKEYHAMVKLAFPDFHMHVVQNAFAAYHDGKENRIKFIDFVRAMKDSFCKGKIDGEASIIHNQLEDKIYEFSAIPSKNGETVKRSTEADFFNREDNVLDKHFTFPSKILDESELKRILNLNDFKSISNVENVSGEKLSRPSAESQETLRSSKTGKKKSEIKVKTKSSINLLQSRKGSETKKDKRRHRSKSADSAQQTQKPWK